MSRRTIAVLLLLSFVLLFLGTAFTTAALGAEQMTTNFNLLAMHQGGRELSRADWVARLPSFFAVVVLTIAVDAFFVVKILRDRRKEKITN